MIAPKVATSTERTSSGAALTIHSHVQPIQGRMAALHAERMKIALVVPGGVDRTGEYRIIPVLLALLHRLSTRYEVHVFCFAQEPQPGRWQLAGAEIHNAGGWSRSRLLRALLSEHARGPFRLIHAIWSGSCSLVAVPFARVFRIPSVVHVAGGELAAIPDIGYGDGLRWSSRLRERVILRAATAVTAATPFMIESLATLGIQAPRLPLGVDLNAWPPLAPRPRVAGDPARLLHVASINRVKDQTTLLRALAIIKRSGCVFHLDFVGEDTLDGAIQNLAAALNLEDVVTFHGFKTQREWRPLAEAAHVFLMSSRHEAGPVVVLEAALIGLPTVGTAVGHIAEWAPEAAVAVPIAHPEQLAAAVLRILDDEALRLRIAKAAFDRSVSEDADYTAAAFTRIYERLL